MSTLLEKRALWLSAYPDEETDATRATCMACNVSAKRLCLFYLASDDSVTTSVVKEPSFWSQKMRTPGLLSL